MQSNAFVINRATGIFIASSFSMTMTGINRYLNMHTHTHIRTHARARIPVFSITRDRVYSQLDQQVGLTRRCVHVAGWRT